MSESFQVSDEFAAFEQRSQHVLDDVRKEEKQASIGNPLPVGYNGFAVLTGGRAFVSKAGDKTCIVEGTIVNDANFEGKTVTVGLQQIKDTERQTAIEAYQRFLDTLEDLGLSREGRLNGKGLGDYFKELSSTPHYVTVSVAADNRARDGKRVTAFSCPPPGDMSGHVPQQETAREEKKTEIDVSKYAQCLYLRKPHAILRDENDVLDLYEIRTGKKREGIPKDDVTDISEPEA